LLSHFLGVLLLQPVLCLPPFVLELDRLVAQATLLGV
jgi:hypothetical protein